MTSRLLLFLFPCILAACPSSTPLSKPVNAPNSAYHSLSVSVPAIDPFGYTVDIAVEPPYTSSAPRRIGAGDNASFGDGEDGTKLPEVNTNCNPTPIGDIPWPLLFLFAAAYLAIKHLQSRSSNSHKTEHTDTTENR